MALFLAYIQYLQHVTDASVQEPICAQLEHNGYRIEASLLRRYFEHGPGKVQLQLDDSPWNGRQAWVGSTLPPEAGAGDIWLDIYEMMPMILLPRDPADLEGITPEMLSKITPFQSWIALRPVANWQFQAFLELAPRTSHPVQVPPPFPLLDTSRMLNAPDNAPVTNLTQGEAFLYALWFSKALPFLEDWRVAASLLSESEMALLWHDLTQEWVQDRIDLDEGVRVVAQPDTFEDDPNEAYEEFLDSGSPIPEHSVFRGEWKFYPNVGFRTAIPTQFGLISSALEGSVVDNIHLLGQLNRV